ncbi:hypothetical protein HPB47_013445, partial [Ixodes persulcatus]
VGERTETRSYVVEIPKGLLVRNKCHLAPLPTDISEQTSPHSLVSESRTTLPDPASKGAEVRTRSGRIIKKSKRFTE